MDAKSGRGQQGINAREVGKNAGIATSKTAGKAAGGVAGDQVGLIAELLLVCRHCNFKDC